MIIAGAFMLVALAGLAFLWNDFRKAVSDSPQPDTRVTSKATVPVPSPERQSPTQSEVERRPSDKQWVAWRAKVDAMPIGGITLEYYLNPEVLAWGERPTVGAIYQLQFLRVEQKVNDGYLMRYESPFGGSAAAELVFLKTPTEFPENFQFTDMGHFAVYAGPYQYQAVNGFTRSIYRFDMFPDVANGWVLDRPHQKAIAKPAAPVSPKPAAASN